MKILFIISSLHFGGAEKQTVIDASLLSENNEVWLATFYDGEQKKFIPKSVKYLQLQKSNYLQTAWALRDIIYENEIELIHSSLFSGSIIAALASLFIKVKVVWHFHSHEYSIPLKSRLLYIISARFCSVRKIYFVSFELERILSKRFYLPRKKVGVLYNSSSIDVKMKSCYKKNNRIIIGYVGRLVELKRVNYLISLAEYLVNIGQKDFEIWIIGDGEQRDRLEECVRNKELIGYVKFWGFQDNTIRFYKQFDIFILPSREECLSIALIDASLSGIPAIAFDVGGNSEIVQNGKTGFVVRSIDELKRKTILLIGDDGMRKSFGYEAHIHCNSFFAPEIRKKRLMSICENV